MDKGIPCAKCACRVTGQADKCPNCEGDPYTPIPPKSLMTKEEYKNFKEEKKGQLPPSKQEEGS